MTLRPFYFGVFLALAAALSSALSPESYSWNQPQARVLPGGDLAWAPRPYQYSPGSSVIYIDYESGADTHSGRSPQEAFKHHPWDPEATANAAATRGVHTYVFKRGVVYRGVLEARDSGTPEEPIRLCSDPSWGQGSASLWGSQRITGGWQRADAESAPGAPDAPAIWYLDIGTEVSPKAMWLLEGDQTTRIPLARTPNWEVDHPFDIHTQWFVWEDYLSSGHSSENRRQSQPGFAIDTQNLTDPDPEAFAGAHLWTEKFCPPFGNMNTDSLAVIRSYDPRKQGFSLKTGAQHDMIEPGQRYFLENHLAFLDSPGEFYFAENYPWNGTTRDLFYEAPEAPVSHPGRLYVRLPRNANPNQHVIEISVHHWPIRLVNQSHIVIEGLDLRFDNCFVWGGSWPLHLYKPSFIRVVGDCRDIRVSHCRFMHVASAFNAFPRFAQEVTQQRCPELAEDWRRDYMDDIVFCDNDIAHSDRAAVDIQDGRYGKAIDDENYGRLGDVRVLRNRFYDISFRQGPSKFALAAAIDVKYAETSEVAGNIIDYCLSVGIDVRGGKPKGDLEPHPLRRHLIHHNKVTNCMLGQNDYGGIETWQGGPFYIYNNTSGNIIGYKNNRYTLRQRAGQDPLEDTWLTQAPAYYLDGSFQNYLFNNIAWGHDGDMDNPYRTRMAFNMVMGFMNHWFNNTAHNFMYGFAGSPGERNSYLGNVLSGIDQSAFFLGRKDDLTVLGGGVEADSGMGLMHRNVMGNNYVSGELEHSLISMRVIEAETTEELAAAFEQYPMRHMNVGQTGGLLLRDPQNHDYRLRPGSAAIDGGVKFFVPWGLYKTVGEWHFYRDQRDPERVLGEAFNMTDEHATREMYSDIPPATLQVSGATLDDYQDGPLEDWTAGALRFDGRLHAVLPHDALSSDYTRQGQVTTTANGTLKYVPRGQSTYPGQQRETVDMGAGSFLIELVFNSALGERSGSLVSKLGDNAGYELFLDTQGRAVLRLRAQGQDHLARSSVAIPRAQWCHLLLEIERPQAQVRFYLNGKPAGRETLPLADDASLANRADFIVGRGDTGSFFGALDFLRVARGTLAQARTTIEELYAWQFYGPFLRDFAGQAPSGNARDAGALEYLMN